MDEELLPKDCPFCKSTDSYSTQSGETGCRRCGANAPSVKMWNTRPIEAELEKEIKTLKENDIKMTEFVNRAKEYAETQAKQLDNLSKSHRSNGIRIIELEKEKAELVEGLRQHGQHGLNCSIIQGQIYKCECGLSALLAKLEPK